MRRPNALLLGAGAVALAIAAAVLTLPDSRDSASPAEAASSPPVTAEAQSAPDAPGAPRAEAPPASRGAPAAVQAQAPPHANRTGAPAAEENWDTPCACWHRWIMERDAQERAAQQAEPVDVTWAYETEQLLAQFIADHPAGGALEVSGVECRTTYCAIEGSVSPDSRELLDQIVLQALEQPWSTLAKSRRTQSSEDSEGRLAYRSLVERKTLPEDYVRPALTPKPTAEECPCSTRQWQSQKEARQAATRAAEPKDPNWAYGVEQQLQQLVAEHPRAIEFQVSTIDCRTTFCNITATAATMEAYDAFGEVFDGGILGHRIGLFAESQSAAGTEGTLEIKATFRRLR